MSQSISTKLQISGVTCGACQKVIGKRVSRIPDVSEVKVDLSGATEIVAIRNISISEISKVLEDTHYKINP